MKAFNPFVLGRYAGQAYFCDREKELKRVVDSVNNQRNLTIISHRRLGKTGLILHFFDQVRKQGNQHCIYIDLMHTRSSEDFIKTFAKAMIGRFDSKTTRILKTFGTVVKSIRPNISLDAMTGEPTLDFSLLEPVSRETSIEEIFTYLNGLKKNILIAFDEFQQVHNYPDMNLEALLRGHIQQTQNATFIFSGSHKHMLLAMFGDSQRPFYQSAELLNLKKIGKKAYTDFIVNHFENNRRKVDKDAVDLILDLTDVHTFYVQFLCNKLFGTNEKEISADLVIRTMLNILDEQEVIYVNYRNLMTKHQFDLLKAIASEKLVKMPTSKDFIRKHRLSAASTIKTSLVSLISKEMILEDEGGYKVYDVFFAQWLRRLSL